MKPTIFELCLIFKALLKSLNSTSCEGARGSVVGVTKAPIINLIFLVLKLEDGEEGFDKVLADSGLIKHAQGHVYIFY